MNMFTNMLTMYGGVNEHVYRAVYEDVYEHLNEARRGALAPLWVRRARSLREDGRTNDFKHARKHVRKNARELTAEVGEAKCIVY